MLRCSLACFYHNAIYNYHLPLTFTICHYIMPFMNMQLTIDKAGRVVIPKKVRDHFGIGAGDSMKLTTDERGVRLEPEEPPTRIYMKNGLPVCRGTGTITSEEVERARMQIYEQRAARSWNPE